MTTTIAAADLSRIVRAVEKSAARDESRPVLTGIRLEIVGETVTATAVDGYRLSTAHATLREPVLTDHAATLDRAALLAFLKLPKKIDVVTIAPDASAWTFGCNGSRASVPTLDGAYPDVRPVLGAGDEPVLFALNAQYVRECLASHAGNMVSISRDPEKPNGPIFFAATDGTRHVIMPMVTTETATSAPRSAAHVEPTEPTEPTPLAACADCGSHELTDGVCAECAGRVAATDVDTTTTATETRCVQCDTLAEPADRFCGNCGTPLGVTHTELVTATPDPTPDPTPVAAPIIRLTNRERVARAQDDLAAAVAALQDSASWRQTLAVMARFHRYSVNNQLLIAAQRPDATYVRGFKGWKDAGRSVRKGERGIRILAPRPYSRIETGHDGEEQIESGIAFTVVSVFDVGQTDPTPGHARPWQPPQRHGAAGDLATARALWNAMVEYAAERDLDLSTDPAEGHGGAYGFFSPTLRRIWVRPDRDLADMCATFAHELAHAVTHDAVTDLGRADREVIAESIAYAVATRYGIDMKLRSSQYVATWLDDPDAFKAHMAVIHDNAADLIDALDELMGDTALALAA